MAYQLPHALGLQIQGMNMKTSIPKSTSNRMLIFMNMRLCLSSVAALSLLSTARIYAVTTPEALLNAGGAGPADWNVLCQGNFSISFGPTTGTANGVPNTPEGVINGNVGVATGNASAANNSEIQGTTYLGPTASGNGGITGGSHVTGSSLPQNALNYAFGTAATYYNGLTPNFTTAPTQGTVAAGVYKLSSWNLNGGTYNLIAGQIYVFDITGNLAPQGGVKILDSTPGDVIFNVTGSFQTSGGLNQEAMIDGIVLATGQISLTPGFVTPEIISGNSINIASGGSVINNETVPDAASTALLLAVGVGAIVIGRREFQKRSA